MGQGQGMLKSSSQTSQKCVPCSADCWVEEYYGFQDILICPLRLQGCFIMGINTLKNHRLVDFFKKMFLNKQVLGKNVSHWDLHLSWSEVDKAFVQSYRKEIFHVWKAFSNALYLCWRWGALPICIAPSHPPGFRLPFCPKSVWVFFFFLLENMGSYVSGSFHVSKL